MKYALIILIAGILALTAVNAIICPNGFTKCMPACENDFASGAIWRSESCVEGWESCDSRPVFDNCVAPSICLPPNTPDGLDCCTPYTRAAACIGHCGETVSSGCGSMNNPGGSITCDLCRISHNECTQERVNIGAGCTGAGAGIGKQYYCGWDSKCKVCAAGLYWNGTGCSNYCLPGETPTTNSACKLSIELGTEAYRWDTATATFDQMKCGESGNLAIGEKSTLRMDCTLLEAGPLGTHHCSDGAVADATATNGRCCPDGQYWDGSACTGTSECYSGRCPYLPSDSRYFTTAECVSSTANAGSPGACCSVGLKHGDDQYYDYTNAAGSGSTNFNVY